MSLVNYAAREISFKIVYAGPGLSGKTSNMQYIYNKTRPELKSKMISLATLTERSLFFDFAPQSLSPIGGLKPRFHLNTVPGPVFYDVARKLVFKGADAIVFVADSQVERSDANVEAIEIVEAIMAMHGLDLRSTPTAVQYNKRDLPSALPVAELDELTASLAGPRFEAVAPLGQGVFESLKAVARPLLENYRAKLGESPPG
jgi:signal recognition particle receptor subunit beta